METGDTGRDGPTAVVMFTDDGEREEVFATRFQAELFLSYLPALAHVAEEFAAVRGAILSPLKETGVGQLHSAG